MTAPPWDHKPPAVDDIERYWNEPPRELSPRVQYWLKRIAGDSWRPNGRFRTEGYYGKAAYLGVYIWEWINLLYPLLVELEANDWRRA